MADYSEMADQLKQEVVSDMAESYFGERKNIDDMLEAFHQMAAELEQFLPLVDQSVSRLFQLLLDESIVQEFEQSLGISFDGLSNDAEALLPAMRHLPFAFTGRGRYEKCLCMVYGQLRGRVNEYINGRYYEDPEKKGRKQLTEHYLRLKALAVLINERMDRVNDGMSPSSTLRYVKEMDTAQCDLENMYGESCLIEGGALDRELRFTHIDFEGLGFPELRELPPLSEVKSTIKTFSQKIYPSHRQRIKDVFAALRDGESER